MNLQLCLNPLNSASAARRVTLSVTSVGKDTATYFRTHLLFTSAGKDTASVSLRASMNAMSFDGS